MPDNMRYESPRTIERKTRDRLRATSDLYYLTAARSAGDGDYFHACELLQKAIRYDKFNIEARNLLGLLQFQQGELADALHTWRLSVFVRADKNRASYYLAELAKEPQLISNMGQSLILYNEALEMARTGQGDFALVRLRKATQLNPRFVKAHLLLCACYIHKEEYARALETLAMAQAVTKLHPDCLRYETVIQEKLSQGAEEEKLEEIRDRTAKEEASLLLNEADPSDLSGDREKAQLIRDRKWILSQFIIFVAGVLLGGLFISYLYRPHQMREQAQEIYELTIRADALEEENNRITRQLEDAREVLFTISEGGNQVSEVVLADVRRLLAEQDQTE